MGPAQRRACSGYGNTGHDADDQVVQEGMRYQVCVSVASH